MEGKRNVDSPLGVPQGGTISPLLSNIYLHELDLFVEKLKLELNKTPIGTASERYVRLHSRQV